MKVQLKNDRSTIDSALYYDGVKQYKDYLKSFIKNQIKCSGKVIHFNDKLLDGTRYNIEINDFHIPPELLGEKYLDFLGKSIV
jgi:hypothetical protein